MSELQFDYCMSPFNMEKLKLAYIKLMTELSMRHGDRQGGAELHVNYCPACKEKLKSFKIDLKEGELLCNHCNNQNICTVFQNLVEADKSITMKFTCDYFIPHNRYLK